MYEIILARQARRISERLIRDHGCRESGKESYFPTEIIGELDRLGLLKMNLPKEYGGLNLTAIECMIILKEIAKKDPQIAYLVAGVNFGVNYPILEYGTENQKKQYFCNDLEPKSKLGLLAFNEPDGCRVDNVKTEVFQKNGKLYLSGIKSLVTNAKYAKYGLIFAKEENNSMTIYIVDMDKEGITVAKPEKLVGMEYLKVSDLTFENVPICSDSVLGKIGQGPQILGKTMEYMRLAIATIATAIAESAFEITIPFIEQRKIGGVKMCELQHVRFEIANIKQEIDIMNGILFNGAKNFEQSNYSRLLNYSTIKKYTTEVCNDICRECLHLFGGLGYIESFQIEKLERDSRALLILGGSSEVLLEMTANMIFQE